MTKQMIDLSEHNFRRGEADWKKVAAAGIAGVMLRAGWAGYDGEIDFDEDIDRRIEAAGDAGLEVGLYVYAYCKTPAAAHIAAQRAAGLAERHKGKINLPIAIDVEETHLPCLVQQGREGLTDTVVAFLFEIERLGWQSMFYTYTAFAQTYLNMQRLKSRELWIADYRCDEAVMQRQLGRNDYGMWQYAGEAGRCEGIYGPCDRNICFKDYPLMIAKQMKNGLFWNPPTGAYGSAAEN